MVFSDTFQSNIVLMEVVKRCIWLHPLIELVYNYEWYEGLHDIFSMFMDKVSIMQCIFVVIVK